MEIDHSVRRMLVARATGSLMEGRLPIGTVWVADADGEVLWSDTTIAPLSDAAAQSEEELPTFGVFCPETRTLQLIDDASIRGAMTVSRVKRLRENFASADWSVIIVSLMSSRDEIELFEEPPWGTVVCFADEPFHLIFFD